MSLATKEMEKQKIRFARTSTLANRPDFVTKRATHVSADTNPNDNDLRANETDKKVHYILPNGKGVQIDSRHAIKDKTGTITGVSIEAANQLEMEVKRAKTPEIKKDEKKNDISFHRSKQPKAQKKNAVQFKRNKQSQAANLPHKPKPQNAIGLGY
tara:strand:+ start:71 stop:538 length:468 start_codon:yes stop_codon:yes gene_type:complete